MTKSSTKRRSAAVKEEAVLRLLRDEAPDAVSRDTGFPLHQLSAWRLAYTSAGRDALKTNRSARRNSQLALAQRLIAKLALEVENLKKSQDSEGGPKTVMRLSSLISETTGKPFPIKTLCAVLGVPRSSFYYFKRSLSNPPKPKPKADRKKPGPKPALDDHALLAAIRNTIAASPFHSEGYRKIHARLKRAGLKASKHRVLRIMRQVGLLSTPRKLAKQPKTHEETIMPDSINRI